MVSGLRTNSRLRVGAGHRRRCYGPDHAVGFPPAGRVGRGTLPAMGEIRYRMTPSPVGFITVAGDGDGGHRAPDGGPGVPTGGRGGVGPRRHRVRRRRRPARRVLRRDPHRVRRDAAARRDRVPASGVGRAAGDPVRRDDLVRRARPPDRAARRASRAVGLANGRNPVGIIVPCHRVIGADGALTGYGGGIDRKRALLDLERSRRQPQLVLEEG